MDHHTGILTWSPEVYKIFGLSEQLFQPNYDLFLKSIHPDDRVPVNQAFTSFITNNLKQYEIEHRVVQQDTGEAKYVLEKCEHIRNSAGKIIRSAGMSLP